MTPNDENRLIKIPLTQGKIAIIDQEDFIRVNKYKWQAQYHKQKKRWYSEGYIPEIRKMIRLHRFIMNPPDNRVVDHINNDSLDNRRANLRVCTVGENNRNRKKIKKSEVRDLIFSRSGNQIAFQALLSKESK